MASAASPSWVILGTVPRVTASDEDLPPGADLSLALKAPPRVALLTIPPRIFPGRTTPNSFPYVSAVDASGILLLKADQDPATVIDTPRRPTVPGYFILNAITASALPLPKPEVIMHMDHLGLISFPGGGGHYMVVELQPILGGDTATADLLRFSSDVGEWVSKSISWPLPIRQLAPNGVVVVCYDGRLWWVDLSWRLLTCDPFEDAPVLRVVPLPPGKMLKCREAWGVLDKYRCVGVSGGKLRFVDMYRNKSNGGDAQISVWTLTDPDSTEWTLECETTFTDIFNDASYKATGLPRKIPVLALIHPTNPDVVYFFLEEHLLGVDVRARKVVACEELVEPPSEYLATRFVRTWQLPWARCPEDNNKRRKTSAGSGASTVTDYRKLIEDQNEVFIKLYEQADKGHATPQAVNVLCGNAGQTATCAGRAINFYNQENGTNYKLEKGGDSNAFNPLQKPADNNFYVHLNCDASDPIEGRHTFFAELKGENEPFIVTMVVNLGNSDDDAEANSADHICIYCTGLRHSLTKEFQGFIKEAGFY